MNKSLIITSECYGLSRADGICGMNLKKGFEKIKKEIFILGYSSSNYANGLQNNNNNEYCFFYYRKKSKKTNSISSLIKPIIDYELVENYIEYAEVVIKKENIDSIIAVYFPIETIIALSKIKEKYPNIKTIIYEVDSATDVAVYTSRLNRFRLIAYKKYLYRIYKTIDYIFVMEIHKKHFEESYHRYIKKVIYIDSPSLMFTEFIETNRNVNKKNTIDFVYTGTLDIDYYSPKLILDFFNYNKDKTNWRLHFYSKGNAEEYIKKQSIIDSRIIQHGYVSKDKLMKELLNADYFISIEHEIKPNGLPSKLFSYFSLLKPVIHFGSSDSYISREYVNKYPLGIVCSNINCYEKTNDFISKNINSLAIYNRVIEIFYKNMPEYSAQIISNILEK